MQIGAFFYATELGAPPAAAAAAAEAAGLESIFVCEHSHVPAPPTTYVDPEGRVLPTYYSHLYDPFIALAAMAPVTERILLGTAVCIVAQRDPVITAKEVATLDHLSRGRIVFGVGTGWNEDELRGHGVEPSAKYAEMRRRTQIIRALWTSESVELGAPTLATAPVAQWPRPYQQPHPPVLVAGNGKSAIRRAIEYGDGLLVTLRHPDLEGAMTEVARAREASGKALPVTIVAGRPDVETLQRYADLGIARALLAVIPGSEAETEKRMRDIARMCDQLTTVGIGGSCGPVGDRPAGIN